MFKNSTRSQSIRLSCHTSYPIKHPHPLLSWPEASRCFTNCKNKTDITTRRVLYLTLFLFTLSHPLFFSCSSSRVSAVCVRGEHDCDTQYVVLWEDSAVLSLQQTWWKPTDTYCLILLYFLIHWCWQTTDTEIVIFTQLQTSQLKASFCKAFGFCSCCCVETTKQLKNSISDVEVPVKQPWRLIWGIILINSKKEEARPVFSCMWLTEAYIWTRHLNHLQRQLPRRQKLRKTLRLNSH